MKNDKQTKKGLIKEMESVRRKVKKMESLREKYKHTQQDITERKNLQKDSDVSEEHYRRAFETSHDGLLHVHRSKGDILDANVYAQELLGYSKEEFLKNNLWGVGVVKDDKDFQEALSRLERDGVIYYDNVSVKNKAGLFVDTEVILVDKIKFIQCNIRDNSERKRAEEQLRQSEELFRLIAENATDLIAVLDLEGKRIYSSPSYKSILGDPESLRGTDSLQEIHPEDREKIRRIFLETVRTGIGQRAEYRFLLEDGSVRYIESQGSVIRDENGNTIKVVVVSREVTERKLVEEEIKKSEGKFRAIFDNTSDGMFLVDLNARKFFMCNAMCMKMLGYTQEEFLTLDINDIHPGEDLAFIDEQIGKFSKGEEGLRSDIRFKRKDGSIFYTDLRPAILAIAEKKYLLINFHDITERKRAEKQITLLAHTLRSVAECVSITDLNDIVLFVNNAFLKTYGYTENEILGKNINIVRSPNNSPEATHAILAATLAGGWSGELMNRTKDGREFPVSLSTSFVRDEKGQDIALVGIATDITEHKLAEDKLQESEERYKALFERSLDLVYVSDFEGNFIDASDAALNLLGYKKEEIGSLNFASLLTEDQLPLAFKVTQEIKETGIQKNLAEFKLRCRNGQEVYVDSIGSAIISDGIPVAIQSIARNITERKRAEEELRETHDYLENLLSFANAPIMVWDNNNKITKFNLAFERLTKYTIFNVAGRHPEILFPDEMREELSALISRTSEGENLITVEMPVRCKDGSIRSVLWNTTNIYSADGKTIIATIAHGQDITKRKQAEEELSESETRYRSVLQSATDAIITADNSGIIIGWNSGAERIFGYSYTEAAGQSLTSLMPLYHQAGHTKGMERVLSGGNEHVIGKTVELEGLRKDKSVFPLELSLSSWETKSGTFVTGIIRDITERKHAVEALQESELRFRSLYENATIGIYRTSPNGNILLANPALVEMLGYTSFQKLAERNLEKEGFESSTQRKEFLEKIERDGEVNGFDSKWIRQDGTAIFVLESARAIRDAQGKTLYYDGTVENITERKLLEDQMRQMQKLEGLGTLAGGIAHDFNNILGIILAFITTIKRFKDDGKKLDLTVDTIVKAVDRGKTLVKQILTFARKSETEFGPVNVNDLVMEIMTMIQETFPKVLTYSRNCDNAIPFIVADRSQLHQVLLNLCVNARDAMSSGGVLTINTRMVSSISLRNQHPDALASSYVCIEVGDTGEGMTEEVRNRIFEPFFTTKEKGKGTGLGLAVVFGVVKTHKGFIEVESELGKGTTFRLYLPVSSAIKPAQTEIQEIVKEIPGGTETLLVVEDEETLMVFIQISLAAKGYTVLSAVDGPEAVKIYRERHKEISMIFTDLGLPGMTGLEEINLIKKINPDVKIIVATGFLDPEIKSELLKAGVKKFILKPYNFEEILKLTREVLDGK
ncbi:MAG: PAS domain S-box protein [Bacteroidota bacterium]|jgi:PAS domain S-box-containing protein